MALQSQTLRGSGSNIRSSSSYSSARRTGPRRVAGLLLLVALVGGGFIWLAKNREGSSLAPRGASAAGAAAESGANPPAMNLNAITAAPPKPEPTILQMGVPPRAPAPSVALPALTNATRPAASTVPLATVTEGPAATAQNQKPLPSASRTEATIPPATTQTPTAQPESNDPSALPGELAAVQALAERAIGERRLVEARTHLNKILVDPRISEKDRDGIRRWMADLNRDLVFSPVAYPGDPLAETYTVEKGDHLIRISRKVNSVSEAGLIQRINGVSPSALRIGQRLKVVKGPFHAVVSKSDFRMDIYAGPTPAPGSLGTSNLGGGAEPGWIYIRSFAVGLGEKGGTPPGAFTVRENSKLINPRWTNPRTGEKFDDDDPKNPIGERWVGLVGLDDKTRALNGYGIHGTIVPESIGREMSMGCIRMASEDVEIVYDMLMGKVSVVKIVP